MSYDEWDDPVAATADFCKPQDLEGHLLIVFPIGYVPHIQTRFTRPDKQSDAIAVDCIDLDAVGDDGAPGKLYRNNNWMQAKLIQALRPKIGKRMLGRMDKGQASNGMNPPWVLTSATGDPNAIQRADAWIEAHPQFKPTEFVVKEPWEQRQMPSPQQPRKEDYRPQPDWSREPADDPWQSAAPRQHTNINAQLREQPPSAPVQGTPDISPEELSMLQRMRQKRDEDAARQAHADRLYPERQGYGY